MLTEKRYTFDRVVRLALAAGLLWAVVSLLDHLSDALIPFVIALVGAYLLAPLVDRVQRVIKRRGVAMAIVLFGTGLVFVCAAWFILPLAGREVAHMADVIRQFLSDSDLARNAAKRLPPDLWQWARDMLARPDIQEFLSSGSLLDVAKAAAAKLLPGVWGVLSGAFEVVLALVGSLMILLYLVFLLADFPRYKEGWPTLFPESWQDHAKGFMAEFEAAMQQYFRGQALIAAIVGVLFAVGFSIIGLPMAILLGLFIGLLNMVPYLQTIGLAPALLLALIQALETGTGFWAAILPVLAVFGVVQLVQDALLTPRIMGERLGLSPAVILLSLSIWGKLLGMLGLIIALPMTCLLWAWYRRWINRPHTGV